MATQHFCLTSIGTGNKPGSRYTVHVDGNIHDAMRELKAAAHVTTSHGKGCSCPSPTTTHPGNTVIREGEVVQ